MIYMSVLKYLWSYTVLSACYLINRIPSSVLNKRSPFSCLYANKTPFSKTPRVFRCTYFVQNLSHGLDKLSPKSITCVFIGYCRTQKDIGVIILPPWSIWCLLMSHSLSLFHISLHRFPSPYLRVSLLHCLCHCLHLQIQILCQCRKQKLQISFFLWSWHSYYPLRR